MATDSKPKTATVTGCVTPVGVLGWSYLAAPDNKETSPNGKFHSEKYEVVLFFPKKKDDKHTEIIKALMAKALKAITDQWAGQPWIPQVTMGAVSHPLRDGADKGQEEYFFIKAKSKNKPLIVDAAKKSIDATTVVRGNLCRLNLTAFPYKKNLDPEMAKALQGTGKKIVVTDKDEKGKTVYWQPSVTFFVEAVQKCGEGNGPIDGGAGRGQEAANEFADDLDTPAASADDGMFG